MSIKLNDRDLIFLIKNEAELLQWPKRIDVVMYPDGKVVAEMLQPRLDRVKSLINEFEKRAKEACSD